LVEIIIGISILNTTDFTDGLATFNLPLPAESLNDRMRLYANCIKDQNRQMWHARFLCAKRGLSNNLSALNSL
jgi:hypothetical protein